MPSSDYTQEHQPKVNWQDKGIGWVPDYPDIRDFNLRSQQLQQNGQLIRAGEITSVEALARSVIELVDKLQQLSSVRAEAKSAEIDKLNHADQYPEDLGILDKLPVIKQDIQGKIFGKIALINVKHHKILKKGILPCQEVIDLKLKLDWLKTKKQLIEKELNSGGGYDPENLYNQYPDHYKKELANYNDQVKAIRFLKRDPYLRKKWAPTPLPPGAYEDWLRDPVFDDLTVMVVQQFQEADGEILVDGIVGVQTNLAIQYHLKQKDDSGKLHKGFSIETYRNHEIEFSSIPPLVDRGIFKVVFEKLDLFSTIVSAYINEARKKAEPDKLGATRQTLENTVEPFRSVFDKDVELIEKLNRCKTDLTLEDAIYESQWVKELLSKDVTKLCVEKSEPLINSLVQLFESLSDKARAKFNCQANQTDERTCLNNYIRIYRQTYFTHEPIMAAVTELVCPLANHESVENAYIQGHDKFLFILFLIYSQREKAIQYSALDQEVVVAAQRAFGIKETINYSEDEARTVWDAISEIETRISNNQRKFYQHLLQVGQKLLQSQLLENRGPTPDILTQFCDACLTKYFYEWISAVSNSLFNEAVSKNLHAFGKYSSNRTYMFEIDSPDSTFAENEPNLLTLPISRKFYEENTGADQNLKEVSAEKTQNIHSQKVADAISHKKKIFFLPAVVDLSYWCSPVEDQANLNACSAHAAIGLIEYFARRRLDKPVTDLSPLFLYKVTRNLMHQLGDAGASIRETMKAMVLFGVPPEEYWPYNIEKLDEEPTPFCYSFAQNFQALKYFRLDYANMPRDLLLFEIQSVIAAGFPCIFGFTLYSSVHRQENTRHGYMPAPDPNKDKRIGGHAAMAVGYDDFMIVPRSDRRQAPHRGALLIRNSWGTEWGQGGYGWLPYDYVLSGLTSDWWSLLKSEWFEVDQFGLGAPWFSSVEGDPVNRTQKPPPPR